MKSLIREESCIWHPFTQMKTDSLPLKVKSGRGAVLELEDGKTLIDCISSWWVTIHGHCHPKIGEAIYKQSQQLEQVIFAGFTHEPAEKLSKMLLEKLPSTLTRVFFSDNGSTAVEVALKQAYQYWINKGEKPRQSFLCFDGGYHGDTIGTMSLGARSIFTKIFDDLLFEVTSVPYPATFSNDPEVEDKEQRTLSIIDRELESKRYAAVVIEPLVQGVAGMRMCRPAFLKALEALVKKHNTLLIYDEVMTGFGRTGDWFACRKSGTAPDIICLAKGLTGGFLPLAVTVCSEEIYQAFYSDDQRKTLFHGHSYTANPLGCAAAIASMELLKENPAVFQKMEERHLAHLAPFFANPKVKDVRCCGTIVAMDLITKNSAGYLNAIGKTFRKKAEEEGLLVRPLGNAVYLMPPYCISNSQLSMIYEKLYTIL